MIKRIGSYTVYVIKLLNFFTLQVIKVLSWRRYLFNFIAVGSQPTICQQSYVCLKKNKYRNVVYSIKIGNHKNDFNISAYYLVA